jgi:dolichol-phosphate mannosyltransferase
MATVPEISVVVPVYQEEQAIPLFLARLVPTLAAISANYEVIFCLDPCRDRTEQVILEKRKDDDRIKLVKFSRRFGQPMATLAGLQFASGRAVVVIDVDLQDPPELIGDMVAKWREGFDVVYAQRRSRAGETLIKRAVSYVGYKIINRIADVEIPPNTGDFRLMSRRVVDQVVGLKESHGFLRGLVALVGFPAASVLFDRDPRVSGKGKYNRFLGSLRIGLNGVICFSDSLLALCSVAGFAVAGLSFLMAVVYAAMRILGVPFPLGNPTIVILVLFLGGVQLISTGVLGQYVGRIYQEVKQRPKYIVDKAYGFVSHE